MKFIHLASLLTVLALPMTSLVHAGTSTLDIVLVNGRVVDGTGAPWFRADVGVRDGLIAAVGDLSSVETGRRIDATGLVVAPGFIDMLGQSEYFLLVDGRGASKITQGITTEITGEGTSIGPINQRMIDEDAGVWKKFGVTPTWKTLGGYFDELERRGSALNLASFVGAGGLRDLVLGQEDRPATAQELEAMKAQVARAMEEGALGLSTSLQYVPDRFASTGEIIELARVAARYGGTYITHQRSESHAIDASLEEVFRVAREAEIPTQIWHLKTACRKNWGRMGAVLKKLEAARADGLDVTANQYPYTAGANNLSANLPLWAREGGKEKMLERLADRSMRARIKEEIWKEDPSWENQFLCSGGPSGIMISSAVDPSLKKYEGRTLEEAAASESADPVDLLMDIVLADRGNTGNIIFMMDEEDVRTALRHPLISFCTDSPAGATDGPLTRYRAHPRAWGSAARILGKYVREEKILTLEAAVERMTSVPASRMGLSGRGLIKPGMAADLAVFDPGTIIDRATYQEPSRHSEGMRYVMVNGVIVLDKGRFTDARPGRVLRGPGFRAER